MRARASLLPVALLAVALAGGLAPASGEGPTARPSAYRLIETLTFLPNTEVTAKTQFQAADEYVIVMRGTIESWSDGTDFRSYWDPWYLYDCTGECGDGEIKPSPSHRPVAFDRRTGEYVALNDLGASSDVPPFNSEHGYRLRLSDFGGELKLRDRLGAFNQHHQGSFTFQIYEKVATPTVTFDFLQNNLRGQIEVTTRGRGKFTIDRQPDLRNGRRADAIYGLKDSVDDLVIRHRDEHVVRDDDVLRLDVESAKYEIKVANRAVYESITFITRVEQSDDPDCPKSARLKVGIVEAKGSGGRGKVVIRSVSGKACEEHDHRAFTKRDKEDTVRVEVKGPKPLR